MPRRKAKKPQLDDTSILLETSAPQSRRRLNSYTSPALLFVIIFTVGVSIMGWFCVQQQQSLDQLSESFTTMQKRITNFQQVMDTTDEQTDTDLDVEERIFALEEAHKQAQEKADIAQATSEKLNNPDVLLQLSYLHDEMETKLAEVNQASLSVTTLQALFKNQSEEFEAIKGSVVAGLSSSSALSENMAGLTDAVATTCSRVDEQVASVEALNAKLEGQASELDELKETMHLHNVALNTNNQEMAAIKELIKAEQALRAKALQEMVSAVQMTLDEQFFTSQTLHSSVMAQLQTFHTQLENKPSWSLKLKSNEESQAAEEPISSAAQNATEVQEELRDVEEKTEQQEAEDEAEVETEEEGEIQEELPVEQVVEGDVTEEQEEEEITEDEAEEETEEEGEIQEEQPLEQEDEEDVIEEQEEEEMTEDEEEIAPEDEEEDTTGQSEEQVVAGDTSEEEDLEETLDGEGLDGSLEEEESEELLESSETDEEESAQFNSNIFQDENEEDE